MPGRLPPWPAPTWGASASEPLPDQVEDFLDGVVAGDQAELNAAFGAMKKAQDGPLTALSNDRLFTALLDRFANSFVLFTVDGSSVGVRRIIKFAYDEPLTLAYHTTSYQGHRDGPCAPAAPAADGKTEPTYGRGGHWLSRWAWAPVKAGLGWTPTLIRFPVPAAEQAAAFHLEVSAPPEVSIVEASLLAGLPNLYLSGRDDPLEDIAAWESAAAGPTSDRKSRRRRRPSFDYIGDLYPTVDLHVVDVPVGSLSRAQVKLQASATGWLTTAVIALWLASAILWVAWLAGPPSGETAPSLLISLAAAIIAVLARPDPHRMITRLLTLVRGLAGLSAILTMAGAVVFAFAPEDAESYLLAFAALSLGPALCVSRAWWVSRRGERAERRVRLSPWEQYLPYDALLRRTDPDFHVDLARKFDRAPYPYDKAVADLGFHQPAIKVASSEGVRDRFPWNREFLEAFQARMNGP